MNDLEKQMHKEFDEKEKASKDSSSKIKADDWVHVRKNNFMGDPEAIAKSLKRLLDQHAAEVVMEHDQVILTDEKPTEPGWYWYSEELYGPSPIYLGRVGRNLRVIDGCGGDDCPIENVSELEGKWSRKITDPYPEKER